MLLLSIILLPLLAAVLLALLGGGRSVARWFALLAAVGTLLISLGIAAKLNSIRNHKDADTSHVSIDGPIQPRLEWRRTWMTLGETTLIESGKRKVLGFAEGDVQESSDGIPNERDPAGKLISTPTEISPPLELPAVTTPIRLEFYLGADGISVLMLALTKSARPRRSGSR